MSDTPVFKYFVFAIFFIAKLESCVLEKYFTSSGKSSHLAIHTVRDVTLEYASETIRSRNL
jgi:hypothetical protein